ncbi:MAG: iron-siderophore ABC transporter substrate-binding protein [Leptolyngbya sp. IPPAS B-1204]
MTLRRVIYFLILGAVIFITISACRGAIYQHPGSLTEVSTAEKCRVIQHTLGETCVPAKPQRIITLDIFSLGNAITLDVKPIASGSLRQEGELPSYLKNYVEGIQNIGMESQPNLEKIMLLKPDLIIGRTGSSQSYSLLSKVAPTVISDWYIGTHWQENFNFITNVLGEITSAQAAWNQYHERVEKIRSILDREHQYKEISVVGISLTEIDAFTKNSFSGSILSELKLQRPKAQDITAEYGYIVVSEEELEKIDGDILFVMVGNQDDEKAFESLKQKPLWQNLRAAQTNQIYAVENHVWWGGNILAANLVLDDLEKYLVNMP